MSSVVSVVITFLVTITIHHHFTSILSSSLFRCHCSKSFHRHYRHSSCPFHHLYHLLPQIHPCRRLHWWCRHLTTILIYGHLHLYNRHRHCHLHLPPTSSSIAFIFCHLHHSTYPPQRLHHLSCLAAVVAPLFPNYAAGLCSQAGHNCLKKSWIKINSLIMISM